MSVTLLAGLALVVVLLIAGGGALGALLLVALRRKQRAKLLVVCPKCGDQTDAHLAACRFCGERIQ